MKLGNVRSIEVINVFGTLSDINYYFVVKESEYMLSYIEEFAQDCFDDWMNEDTDEPLGSYIVRRMRNEYNTKLEFIGEDLC